MPALQEFLEAEGDDQAYTALDQAIQDGCTPEKVLLLCACLMLADEARTAIRFIRETPGLDYLLETRQQSLESSEAEPSDTDDLDEELPVRAGVLTEDLDGENNPESEEAGHETVPSAAA